MSKESVRPVTTLLAGPESCTNIEIANIEVSVIELEA